MKDKELREIYVDAMWKVRCDIENLKREVFTDAVSIPVSGNSTQSQISIRPTLSYHVSHLEKQVKELIENQKLIMDYLKIQKITEPEKSYMISTSELKCRPERD